MDKIRQVYPVGMIVVVGAPCLRNPAQSRAVVYEHYRLGDHVGISLIFPNGEYDGFSERDLELADVYPTGIVDPQVSRYQFSNVLQLQRDFQAGVFARALKPQAAL